jgi:hypothetical protein
MGESNIIEVKNLMDLKSVMKTQSRIILGLTLPNTPNESKVMIRKFLKRKAAIFPLIMFVYMEVADEYRTTSLNILQGDDMIYPKVYHISNTDKGCELGVTVLEANNESINESFNNVEKYYINDMKLFKQRAENIKRDKELNRKQYVVDSDDNNNNNENNDSLVGDNYNTDNQSHISDDDNFNNTFDEPHKSNNHVNDNKKNKNNNELKSGEIALDPLLEKQKNIEKFAILNKKYSDMKLDFVRNIAKRKKIESELDKKKLAIKKKEDDPKAYRKKLRKTGT